MPRRTRVGDISELVSRITRQLKKFQVDYSSLKLRDRVRSLTKVKHSSDDLGVSVVHDSIACDESARARIEAYFLGNVGAVIAGDELAVVSGVSEYGRRIRELRVEFGYKIFTGSSSDSTTGLNLRPDEYLLTSSTPDADAARRWHVANRIRKMPGGAKGRILEYLRENVLRIVTTEEIRYVAKTSEFPRRIRELRTEDGYAVATYYTGRPDLGQGEYVLLDATRVAEPHDRKITVDVQQEVYARDNNRCRLCAWHSGDWDSSDPRILELHHFVEHNRGGENTADNLLVLCSKCHDEVHAGRVSIDSA